MKRSGLKPPTAEQVAAWNAKPRTPIKRTALKQKARKPIAKIGRKKKRELADEAAFRHDVKERAGGYCEAPRAMLVRDRLIVVEHSSEREPHRGAHAHHVFPEDRDAGFHDPDRGLYLCSGSHRWTHDNPADAKIARLLRPDPA